MRFGLIHRVMTDTLAAMGILALVTSGKLHPFATIFALLGLVVGIFLPERFRQQAYVQVTGVAAPLIVLAVQIFRLSLGGDPIPIVVEFAATLQVIRLITRRGAAHDHQVILLALLHLIAGTVLGGGLTYAVALAGFLIFTPGALVLSHLRREVEGNYRQGARDRTGMPVDVPRILRSRRVVGRGFLLFTCSLSLPVFLFSALLFAAFPRVGFAWLSVPPISPSRMVGFSNRVDLGGVGTIRSDPTLVMRVRVPEAEDAAEPPMRRNFYLRGAVFDTYDGRSWVRRGASAYRPVENGNHIMLRRPPRPNDRHLDIDLNRIDPPVVFVPGEAVALEVEAAPRHPRQGGSIVTADIHGQLAYDSVEREGIQYRVFLPPQGLIFPEREPPGHLSRYLTLPSQLSPRIVSLAAELSNNSEDPLEAARVIEKALRENYTYDLASPSGAAADPLDHFLFESKRGHCEFYSTAMVILLRTLRVPSRNVTGFVGGTYNRFGDFYSVRQGDAHSWVEVYLPERGWIRFDPTPPSSAVPQAATQGAAALLRELFEAASQSWRRNVLGFDMENQLSILRGIKKLLKGDPEKRESSGLPRWNYRRFGLVLAGFALIVAAVWIWSRRRRSSEGPSKVQLQASALQAQELYRLVDRTLVLAQVPRPQSTPPLTHAQALLGSGHPMGPELVLLTQIYLDARYGQRLLSDEEIREFRQRVSKLRRSEPSKAA